MGSAAGLFFDTVEEPADWVNEPDSAALTYESDLLLTVSPPTELLQACFRPICRSGFRIIVASWGLIRDPIGPGDGMRLEIPLAGDDSNDCMGDAWDDAVSKVASSGSPS